jgi:hypothetical protein
VFKGDFNARQHTAHKTGVKEKAAGKATCGFMEH